MELHRLVLYADYFADPLWTDLGGKPNAMIRLEDLPLPDDLRSKLRTWAATFDSLADNDYEWPSQAARAQWNQEGELLRNHVAEVLGQAYSVIYRPYE